MPVNKMEVSLDATQAVKNCCGLRSTSIEANNVESKERKLPIISLFSGALGLDLGLEQAGFETRVAVECNKFAVDTLRNNRPNIPVIEKKIEDVTTEEILETAGLKPGEPFIVSGGPSCQSFSTVGQNQDRNWFPAMRQFRLFYTFFNF